MEALTRHQVIGGARLSILTCAEAELQNPAQQVSWCLHFLLLCHSEQEAVLPRNAKPALVPSGAPLTVYGSASRMP